MYGFSLPDNFIDDPEKLVRKKQAKASSSVPTATLSDTKTDTKAPPVNNSMANKTLREFSVPSTANIKSGVALDDNVKDFELKTSLITMVQANTFDGLGSDDANGHLQVFIELCDTIKIKDVDSDVIRLRLFPFSLTGRAKTWFYANHEKLNTWEACSNAFLAKYFPAGKTNLLRGKISNFQQAAIESIPEAWER